MSDFMVKLLILKQCQILWLHYLYFIQKAAFCVLVYSTKNKRTSKIFQLSSPFNANMAMVIKYQFLTAINFLKLKRGVEEYLRLQEAYVVTNLL